MSLPVFSLLIASLPAAVAGCGSSPAAGPDAGDGATPPDGSTADGPRPDVAPDGTVADVPAEMPFPFGIETRPSNTTCRAPATPAGIAPMLSGTGCVDPQQPRLPAAGVIPYDLVSPLWSDGAAKERFFAIPDGTRIHVKSCAREPDTCAPGTVTETPQDDGDWEFPVGTVLIKSFLLNGKRIETRLLIRFNEFSWAGFSYQWDDAETDAVLLGQNTEGYTKDFTVGGVQQTWRYPSRAQCLQCHTDAAGVALGPETRQMNRMLAYPSGRTSDQIATLDHIGMFDATPVAMPAYPTPATTAGATVEARARSYLHANCAICHRPMGNFPDIDLRNSTALRDMALCNAAPEKGEAGVPGALRLVPGMPSMSLISIRMHALDGNRMPQIGSSVVDATGTTVVDQWIASLTACPQ